MQTPTLAGSTYDKSILSQPSTEVEFAGAVLVQNLATLVHPLLTTNEIGKIRM
jgi:hypothetical protein